MPVYHGRGGVAYIAGTAAGAASLVASLTQWTLDMATDRVDVTAFGDLNKTYVQGLKDIKGNISGFWNDTENKIFTAADETAGVRMYLYPNSTAPTVYWYGLAWIDYSLDVSVSDAAKMSGTFAAAASWGRKP